MQNISFTRSGEIEYKINDRDIENDLNKILNLNCKTLVENRKRVKDAVRNLLIKHNFKANSINKQLLYWSDEKEYCQVAIEELNKHKN